MKNTPSKKRKFLFTSIIFIFFAGISSGLLFVVKRFYQPYYLGPRIRVYPSRQFFIHHPKLGYSVQPGSYKIDLFRDIRDSIPGKCFNVIIDKDGYRTTSSNPIIYRGLPQIWVFGCSFTWGWPIDNYSTYPWLMQQGLASYSVKNFGCNGYGNIHALIQLRDMLESKNPLPKYAIFTYADFHIHRNSAIPTLMKAFHRNRAFKDPEIKYPRGYMDSSGELKIKLIPFDYYSDEESDPSFEKRVQISIVIFRELYTICKSKDIIPILAVLSRKPEDPVVEYCKKIGYHYLDIFVDYKKKEFNCMPIEPHPNEKAQMIYAKKIIAFIHDLDMVY